MSIQKYLFALIPGFTGRLQGISMADLNILLASDPHTMKTYAQDCSLAWKAQFHPLLKMLSSLLTVDIR